MTFSITYKPLFEVKILHLYYLDKGNDEFFLMNDKDKKKQLADFDISTIFELVPSTVTLRQMAGHKLVFKTTNTGFTVWAHVSENSDSTPLVTLDDTLEFTFLLKLIDHNFYNLTHLDLSNAGKLFFFSNRRLNTESPGFPLIKKSNVTQAAGDDYVLSVEGEKDMLGKLSSSEKKGLFGIINLSMKGDNSTLNITTAQQKIRNPFASFQLVFRNRKTYWRYFFRTDQTVKNKDDVEKENGSAQQLVTKKDHPLTEKGFIKIELDKGQLPNPDASIIKPNEADNKIYSEIYM
ncbi:hypothetical protein [Maribellus mangrovi]|uniref:hypothetical protein n=1 Tax=Maribellus mangrovi TaxID=3133146 RepID=UPI0030EEA9F4